MRFKECLVIKYQFTGVGGNPIIGIQFGYIMNRLNGKFLGEVREYTYSQNPIPVVITSAEFY